MEIIIIVLSIYFFIKNISYGLFELNTQKNKAGGITILVTSAVALIVTNILIWIR